ncbi:MAG: Ca2+-dependent phosphoinositide-specific phospholipase C [Candidatus Brevundimonas colombiensis]|uniref:Ca2+-dependent phosphoinositide-specific phospholipase C n=1 Tax=Candidatus Brevundimonas colombiensis TaxID=3121376 RepID=A0AAJ6BK51_9CAUL|nr:Ca2+-dependent phosphoinositide-specific phospholipase C [Brevundimonas sp.]WEK40083.1 MAG: Ca2+-dependent phosphoinositide-specific phospholipase C [Brevundimonas sp.]
MSALIIALLLGASPCEPTAADVRAAGGDACARAWMDRSLRMNDIAVVGTHNSYKLAIPEAELAAMTAVNPAARGLDYSHRPLVEQLDAGARQLEIDVLNDPDGGRYARPASALGGPGHEAPTSPSFRAAMTQPGMKVLHMPDVDFRASCLTFTACLTQIRDWSTAHPDHAPILIMLNAKTGSPSMPGGVAPLAFDAAAWDALDAQIRAVFDAGRLITPDQVRGNHATLRDGVLAGGWPTLGQARGKVFFALDEGPEKVGAYSAGRPSLQGRAMFVNTDEASPAAAYLTLNDPVVQKDRIQAAVRQGFIVRTRADADTVEARTADISRRTAAFASGAQYVSTDYYWADPRFPAYEARLPGAQAAACNPVRTEARCDGLAVEMVAGAPVRGYLSPADRPDLTQVLAPPPAPGSPRDRANAEIFRETRALQGGARWRLATADVDGDKYDHFAQALGVRLTPETAPVLTALLDRSGNDRSVVGLAKDYWGTKRPYIGTDLPICEAKSDHLAGNPDYPSGHSAHGMHIAMILAELAPQRADALYARGREFAESRFICGSHSYSAVEAGILSGAVLYGAEQRSETFRRDMEAARAEVQAALAKARSDTGTSPNTTTR